MIAGKRGFGYSTMMAIETKEVAAVDTIYNRFLMHNELPGVHQHEHNEFALNTVIYLATLVEKIIHPKCRYNMNYGSNANYGYGDGIRYFICYSSKALAEMFMPNGDIELLVWDHSEVRPKTGSHWCKIAVVNIADPECFAKVVAFFHQHSDEGFPKLTEE